MKNDYRSDEPYMTIVFRKLTDYACSFTEQLSEFSLSNFIYDLFLNCVFIQGKILISLLWIRFIYTLTGFIGAYFSGIKRFNVTAGQAANIDAIIISYKCKNKNFFFEGYVARDCS
jgi:hypothetical protein